MSTSSPQLPSGGMSFITNTRLAASATDTLQHTILQLIIARDKNLLVRCPDEDVSNVVKVVLSILQSLSLPTTKLKLWPTSSSALHSRENPHPHQQFTPTDLLRSLFLEANKDNRDSGLTAHTSHNGHKRHAHPHAFGHGYAPKGKDAFRRSSSYSNDMSVPIDDALVNPASTSTPSPRVQEDYPLNASGVSQKRRDHRLGLAELARPSSYPFIPSKRTVSNDLNEEELSSNTPAPSQNNAPANANSNSMSSPLTRPLSPPTPTTSGPVLPQVLVISGLEHASVPVQRTLLQVLQERRVVLDDHHDVINHHHRNNNNSDGAAHGAGAVYNLPDGFFVICVSLAGDGRERPAFHRSLVDRFAMSITVTMRNEGHGAGDGRKHLPHTLSNETVDSIAASLLTQQPFMSPNDIAKLQKLTSPTHTSIHSRLSLYVSDLFTATRHHPHLDGTLLTARAHTDMQTLLRARRVFLAHYSDLRGIKQSNKYHGEKTANKKNDAGEEEEDVQNAYVYAYAQLDVLDEDVRAVFPLVVGHRMRVRDGPTDEILASAVFGAAGKGNAMYSDGMGKEEEWEWAEGRRGVGEILREVMESV